MEWMNSSLDLATNFIFTNFDEYCNQLEIRMITHFYLFIAGLIGKKNVKVGIYF